MADSNGNDNYLGNKSNPKQQLNSTCCSPKPRQEGLPLNQPTFGLFRSSFGSSPATLLNLVDDMECNSFRESTRNGSKFAAAQLGEPTRGTCKLVQPSANLFACSERQKLVIKPIISQRSASHIDIADCSSNCRPSHNVQRADCLAGIKYLQVALVLCLVAAFAVRVDSLTTATIEFSENQPTNNTHDATADPTTNIVVHGISNEPTATTRLNAADFLARLTSVFKTTIATATTTTPIPTTNPLPETTTNTLIGEDDTTSTGHDADDAEGCEGISNDGSAEAKNVTDNERLVNLQSCIQRNMKRNLKDYARSGMEMFQKLTLSGGCTSSILNLATSLGDIKSFAFKFLDASAKIPSGVMYGLLSDFGDFDQCLSIRSNPAVAVEDEAEESAYSGKYCLLSVKLNYRAHLEANQTVPDGIIEDGLIWDQLVRNYWTSKSTKGFQVGVCLPSRCTNEDLNQIYNYLAQRYNVVGRVMSCQDSLDLKKQYQPDLIQHIIIYAFYTLVLLTFIGTSIHWHYLNLMTKLDQMDQPMKDNLNSAIRVLLCFSIIRNWNTFMSSGNCKQVDFSYFQQQSSPSTRSTIVANSLIDCQTSKSESDLTANKLSVCSISDMQVTSEESLSFGLRRDPLSHLSGLKLIVIIWITIGYSFLYPSANNYQYYRSIINMNITRDSVWFATTNFTLGIDMLLYMSGFAFVFRLFQLNSFYLPDGVSGKRLQLKARTILQFLVGKALRFWPNYLAVIALALIIPLFADGPMWPEMVTKRLGESCRRNWWSNLLFMNNFLSESQICIPSSWFISVTMQMFLVGSIIFLLMDRISLNFALSILVILLVGSCGASFGLAYYLQVRAPVIKMDESFVMEIDDTIFRLYTNTLNNLGPFLVGMLGGFLLIKSKVRTQMTNCDTRSNSRPSSRQENKSNDLQVSQSKFDCKRLGIALVILAIATLVLSSVFHQDYTRFWASIYWSLHRVGWAIVTGYIIHNGAIGRCKLLHDLLSLSTSTLR